MRTFTARTPILTTKRSKRGAAGRIACAVALCVACAPAVVAQTAPVPRALVEAPTGLLGRADWFLSVGALKSGDPRFSWAMRGRLDVDLIGYRRGRVNLFVDDELMLG